MAEILAYSYKLHQCQLTAQAVKLYELVNNLLSASWGGNSTVEAILLFLANLAGEAEDCAQDNSLKVSHDSTWWFKSFWPFSSSLKVYAMYMVIMYFYHLKTVVCMCQCMLS